MVTVKGTSLKRARLAARDENGRPFSERKLAERYAKASGDDRKEGTIRAYLRRIERREGDTELSADEAEALATVLGIEPEHLAGELVWTWALPPGEGVYSLGTFVVAFTSAEDAKRWRDALALSPLDRAPQIQLRATTRETLARGAVDQGDAHDELIDPPDSTIRLLSILEQLLLDARKLDQVPAADLIALERLNLGKVRQRLVNQLNYAQAMLGDESRMAGEIATRAPHLLDPVTVTILVAQLRNLSAVIRACDAAFMKSLDEVLGADPTPEAAG